MPGWKHPSSSGHPPEPKLVHSNGKVPWLLIAAIEVAVVHGDEVHIAEDEAVILLIVLERLQEPYVEQLGPVEGVLTELKGRVQ